jgi:hypothetical protein
MDYKIISVESRKGGVGKTTAALNLARLLLDNNFTVLLIDIDITGTNITDTIDSSYWKEKINSIHYQKEPVNLLKLYQNHFMCGKDLPSWQFHNENSKKGNFSIRKDQINIIGSEIYNHSKSPVDKNSESLICNPSILFDELHTFWFVEFLKRLCNSFANKANCENIAIVFDNSPGFIGINPAIQEWLSDIGPIRGKFLTISSLDKQDLISCSKSIEALHSKFETKYIAAKKYLEMVNDNEQKIEFILEGSYKEFFMRIISDSIDEETKKYYDNSAIIEGDKYINTPSKYQSIIINKVPKEIKTKIFSFDFWGIWNAMTDVKIAKKLLENRKYGFNNFVCYDENINFQFVETSLKRPEYRERRYNSKGLIKYLDNIESSIIKSSNSNKFNKNYIEGSDHYEFVYKNINTFQDKYNELIEKLKVNSFQNIVRLLDSEWNPKTPFETLRQYFSELLSNSGFPMLDFELGFDEQKKMPQHYFAEIFHVIESRIHNEKIHTIPFEDLMYNFSYKAVIYLTIVPFNARFPIIEEYSDLFISILSIQSDRLNMAKEREKEKFSLLQFLVNERLKENDLEKLIYSSKFKRFHIPPPFRESFIVDFYHSFCNAQARLLDLEKDFDFLIFIIKKTIMESYENEKIFFPYIQDILNKVIVDKTVPHTKARESAKKGFVSANYMTEFQSVLKNITKEWEIL